MQVIIHIMSRSSKVIKQNFFYLSLYFAFRKILQTVFLLIAADNKNEIMKQIDHSGHIRFQQVKMTTLVGKYALIEPLEKVDTAECHPPCLLQ